MHYSESTFEQIYHTYFRRVYSFLYKLCHDTVTAEDLTQETFYQAYRSLGRYDGTCEMFTWLVAIAKNLFFKFLRRRNREPMLIDLYITEPELPFTEEPGYRLIKELEASDLRRAISSMPEKYSDVLILRIYGELSYKEIAAKLGISESSAKVIFFRAKNRIKEILLDE